MGVNSWNKISEILVDCLEFEGSERQKYLDSLNLTAEMRAEMKNFWPLKKMLIIR